MPNGWTLLRSEHEHNETYSMGGRGREMSMRQRRHAQSVDLNVKSASKMLYVLWVDLEVK